MSFKTQISMERMRDETSLVVLEYLNLHTMPSTTKKYQGAVGNREHSYRSSLPHCGNEKSNIPSNRVDKRRSVSGPCNDELVRRRLSSMIRPLNQKLAGEIRTSIANFDTNDLRKTSCKSLSTSSVVQRHSHQQSILREIPNFDRRRLRHLPRDAVERNGSVCYDICCIDRNRLRRVTRRSLDLALRPRLSHLRPDASEDDGMIPESPLTCATIRLEEMSQYILKGCPSLLDEQVDELLTPIETENHIPYEIFRSVARSIYETHLPNVTQSAWSKVALVLYLVKQVMFSGVISGMQIDLLVDYATRFVAESSFDDISKEGGWVALECQSEDLLELRDELPFFIGVETLRKNECFEYTNKDSRISKEDSDALWTKPMLGYSSAVLAVAIGFLYAYWKLLP